MGKTTDDMRDGRGPSASSTRTPERSEPEPDSALTGRGHADSRYVALVELQRLAGNRATSRLIGTRAVQRDAAVATPEAPPGGGPASPATAGAPGPGGAPVPGKEHRILDRATNAPIVVDEAQWKAEGQHLVKRVKTALKMIPEDSAQVLDDYPLAEVRDMYAACMDAVKEAIEALRLGSLVEASRQMHNADSWTGIEIKAHKLLMDMGVLKYVGGQLDHAVIGFFQGAADGLLGLVDGAASLFDVDTGLVAWNDKQYHEIQEAYTGVSGIDIDHVMAGSIGKMGGQLAEGLATFETLGGAGNAGKVVMGVEAAAGVKSVGEKVVKMRSDGKSWSAIFGDPSFLAECAGAIAGAAGAGASFAGPLSIFLKEAGMIASEAQIAVTVDAIVDVQLDKSLSVQARNEKTVQLLGQGLQTLAAVADGAAKSGGAEPSGGAAGGETEPPSGGGGGGGGGPPAGGGHEGGGVPTHVGPEGDQTYVGPAPVDGVPIPVGPEGDQTYIGPAPSDGVPVPVPGHESTQAQPANPYEQTHPVDPAAPTPVGPDGDQTYIGPAPSDGVPVPVPGHESTQAQPANPYEQTHPVDPAAPTPVGPDGDQTYIGPAPSDGVPVPVPGEASTQSQTVSTPAEPDATPAPVEGPADAGVPAVPGAVPESIRDWAQAIDLGDLSGAEPISSVGDPGSVTEAGGGVYDVPLPDGSTGVAKMVPDNPRRRAAVEAELERAYQASRTGIGGRAYGLACAVINGNQRIGFVMDKAGGGFIDLAPRESWTPEVAAAATAEAAHWRSAVNETTIETLDAYGQRLLDNGQHYSGELQYFVDENGRFQPIDFQGIDPLPTEPEARQKAIDEHNKQFAKEHDDLEKIAAENAAGHGPP